MKRTKEEIRLIIKNEAKLQRLRFLKYKKKNKKKYLLYRKIWRRKQLKNSQSFVLRGYISNTHIEFLSFKISRKNETH